MSSNDSRLYKRASLAIIVLCLFCICLLAYLLLAAGTQNKIQKTEIAALKQAVSNEDVTIWNDHYDQMEEHTREAITGVYQFDPRTGVPIHQIDLRSDGSGIICDVYENSMPTNKKKISWSFSDGNSIVWVDGKSFKPERGDLIDSSGNRWEKTR